MADGKMKQNEYYSYNSKDLPKGCQHCVKGEKVVLFVTGVCPRQCNFCPVSDEKYQKDVIFANERKILSDSDLIKEAEMMKASGAGITGGDPLTRLERTCTFIINLKKKFGNKFHIHLYTSLNLVNEKNLAQLFEAGLDEIRFHLDWEDDSLWENLELARKFSWDVGVEVPLLIDKDYKKMIDFVHDKADFINLNELETADNTQFTLQKNVKDPLSYAVKGSVEFGLKVLEYAKKYDLAVHLCTAKLKDAIQLTNRIKRESEGAKKKFDIVDEEGMLIRGALYLCELKPGFSYRDKLKTVDKEKFVNLLEPLLCTIKDKFGLGEEDIFLDTKKCRILVSKKLVNKEKNYFDTLGLIPAIVTEYPTADQLEIEVEFLN